MKHIINQYYKDPSDEVGYEEIFVVDTQCPKCQEVTTLEMPTTAWALWVHQGAYIQDAFPSFSVAQREMLKTGICDSCWKLIFSGEEG